MHRTGRYKSRVKHGQFQVCHRLKPIKLARRFVSTETVAMRKLAMLNRAANLDDLLVPPGNRLEALKGDRRGQHSIRVNSQWRICFRWTAAGAEAVEIVDYH